MHSSTKLEGEKILNEGSKRHHWRHECQEYEINEEIQWRAVEPLKTATSWLHARLHTITDTLATNVVDRVTASVCYCASCHYTDHMADSDAVHLLQTGVTMRLANLPLNRLHPIVNAETRKYWNKSFRATVGWYVKISRNAAIHL